jgi:hypothetical protein
MPFQPASHGRLVSRTPAPVAPEPAATPAAPAPEKPNDPRARIVAALHQRWQGASDPPTNLPALIADLPGDETRAPQTQFTLDLRVAFLEALAVSGSVRSAARRVKVSHQCVYRARRSDAAFGRAWDAALVVARAQAEAKLADCAMEGFEEEVWYHGELVGTRTRFSERLLLAHLGRLDRMRTDTRIEALAEDFDAMLARMRAGEAIDVEVADENSADTPQSAHAEPVEAGWPGATTVDPAGQLRFRQAQGERREENAADISSLGQCNTRSMSPEGDKREASPGGEAPEAHSEPRCDCIGARHGTDGGQPHYRKGPDGPEPVANVDGCGPCCDHPRWPECRACPHYPPVSRLLHEMEDARPEDAPPVDEMEGDPEEIEQCQMAAFEAGDEDWWRYGADFVLHARNALGYWAAVAEEAG